MSESIESVPRKQIDTLHERLASQTERDGMEQANLRAQLERARASEKRLAEALDTLLGAIEELAANSEGVTGLHLNGDIATWGELLGESRFRTWLGEPVDAGRAALSEMEGA